MEFKDDEDDLQGRRRRLQGNETIWGGNHGDSGEAEWGRKV